jgi:hypothetical protein
MDGRRELPRWKIKKMFSMSFQNIGTVDCIIEDLNLKGMCLSSRLKLPQDRLVKMGLMLPGDIHVEVDIQVPWIKESQGRFIHGLSFNRMMDEDKDKLYRYINNHCSDQLKQQWWQNTQ